MNETSKKILEVLKPNGKSAPEMTHALKYLGDGSMETGLSKIGDYFAKEVKNARIEGAVGGVLTTTLIVGIVALVKKKMSESKEHNQEGEIILKDLEDGLAEYQAENNSN